MKLSYVNSVMQQVNKYQYICIFIKTIQNPEDTMQIKSKICLFDDGDEINMRLPIDTFATRNVLNTRKL
jgi:hypothetical protein